MVDTRSDRVLERHIDGDTTVDEQGTRSRAFTVAAPESKLTTVVDGEEVSEENLAGQIAADKMRAFAPKGTEIKREFQRVDQFGRSVSKDAYIIDGYEVDHALIAFDNDAARYTNQYSVRGDETADDPYRVYLSKNTPHEIGAVSQGLTEEEFAYVHNLRKQVHTKRDEVMQAYSEEGQRELNSLSAELYGKNKDKLLAYQFMLNPYARKQADGSYVMDGDRYLTGLDDAYQYNARMAGRQAKVDGRFDAGAPEEDTSFLQDVKTEVVGSSTDRDTNLVSAYFRQTSGATALSRMEQLASAERYKDLDKKFTAQEKLAGVPPEYWAEIMGAKNDAQAMVIRDQVLIGLQDKAHMEASGFFANAAAGTAGVLLDPVGWVAGGVGTRVGMGTYNGLRALGTTSAQALPKMLPSSALPFIKGMSTEGAAKVSSWVAGSTAGSAALYAPNALTDPTTSARHYMLSVLADGAMGGGFGLMGVGNRALAGTKLGDKIGLFNADVLKKAEVARDAYFERVSMDKADALASLNRTTDAAGVMTTQEFRDAVVRELEVVKTEKAVAEPKSEAQLQARLESGGFDPAESLAAQTTDAMYTALRTRLTADEKGEVIQRVAKQFGLDNVDETGKLVPLTNEQKVDLLDKFTVDVLADMTIKEKQTVEALLPEIKQLMVNEQQLAIERYNNSGQAKVDAEALKAPTLGGYVGQVLGNGVAKEMTVHFLASENPAMNYIGHHVTELAQGMSGNVTRRASGGLTKARVYDQLMTEYMPGLEEAVNAFGASKGHGAYQRAQALESAADSNATVREFGREAQLYFNAKRMGKTDYVANPHVQKFMDGHWTKFTQRAHNELVSAKVAGYKANRQITNYVPRVYEKHTVEAMVAQHGEKNIVRAIEKGLLAAPQNEGKLPLDPKDLRKLAEGRLSAIRGLDDSVDQYMPGLESASKERLEMDLSANHGGFTLVDLVKQDIADVGQRYTHRASGWIGLAESTDGVINSNIAWDTFKQEAARQSKDGRMAKDAQLLEDVYAMMMGMPTRGGLPGYLRTLRDMAVVTQMGALGLNEVMEAGLSINRAVIHTMRDPEVAGQYFSASRGGKQTEGLLQDVVSLTGITDAMDKLERHGTHLDQANPSDSKIGRAMDSTAYYMSGGENLPLAKRLLAQTTGFNMARRAKYRVAQMSMALDLAKRIGNQSNRKALTSDARLRDLGALEKDGSSVLSTIFNDPNKAVYKNGNLERINFDRLTTQEKNNLGNVLYRAASQDVQKHIIGETPAYLNNPYWNVALQYLSFPLVATNKNLARNMKFADIESITGLMLNLGVTGLVQYTMAQLGLRKGDDVGENTYKYYSSAGILPDISIMGMDAINGDLPDLGKIPITSVMRNYGNAIGGTAQYVMSAVSDDEDKKGVPLDDYKSIMYLNNHATLRAMYNVFNDEIGANVVDGKNREKLRELKQRASTTQAYEPQEYLSEEELTFKLPVRPSNRLSIAERPQVEPKPSKKEQALATQNAAAVNASIDAGPYAEFAKVMSRVEAGTAGADSINYKAAPHADKNFKPTESTLSEVITEGKRLVRAQRANGVTSASSAMGKYQMITGTIEGGMRYLKLPKDTVFTEEVQDRIAVEYILKKKRPAIQRYMEKQQPSKSDETEALLGLAKEWASFPVPHAMQGHFNYVKQGESYYRNNGDGASDAAHVSVTEAKEVLKSLRT